MKIHLYHANAGHGHRKVAEVIAETFHKRGLPEGEVKIWDALDFTPPFFKALYPALYFNSIKYFPKIWGWFYEKLDLKFPYHFLKSLRHLHNRIMAGRLLRHVQVEKPDVILCTHFLSAEFFASAKAKKQIQSLLITVITDFLPHSFWINEGTDFYWIMGEDGKKELMRRGVLESQIIAGGIPCADAFKPSGLKNEILKKWQFDPERFTLLITSGSFGLGQQEAILSELVAFRERVQCFVVCGNNHALYQDLKTKDWPFPVEILGFVDFMPDLMEASDLVIAKSGGATSTESLAKGLPMVIFESIPGQETRNAKILLENDVSFTMSEPAQIKIILKAIFDHPEVLKKKREQIKKLAKPHAADDLVTFVLERIECQAP